jgi:signal transduction histidine kinase
MWIWGVRAGAWGVAWGWTIYFARSKIHCKIALLWLQFEGTMATASSSSLWKLSRVNELSRIPLSGTQILRTFGPALLVASSYYLGTRIGFAWTPSGQPNSSFWPANAILLAALLLAPQRIWWALLLAVLPAHMIAQLQSGVPVWTASGWFITNSAEGLIGAFLITRFTRQESLFDTVRGVLTFVVCGVLIAPLLTSFVDAAAVVVTGWGHGYWPLGAERFWTNALAELTIVPAVVLGGVSGITWIRNANSGRRWEAVLLGVSAVLASVFVFGFHSAFVTTTPAVLYFPLPLLLWAAVRFRLGGLSLSLLCVALISMWYTIHGRLAFPYASMQQNILSLQILFCLVGVPLMFLSVVVDERRRTQESLQLVSTRLLDAQEKERARIGRELHDDINQRLAVISVELQQLQEDPFELQKRVPELRGRMAELSNDVQAMSHDLHSSKLEYLGVVGGIRSWCKEFAERRRMVIDFSSEVSRVLSPELGLTLLRVVQEALYNATKHSGVRRAEVQLLEEDSNEIHLIVSDSGRGFDMEEAAKGRGLGLTSMSERVRLVNGTIRIDSKPMGGTRIHVHLPVESGRASQRVAV